MAPPQYRDLRAEQRRTATPDSSYTEQVRNGGLAAVDAARQSRRWGTESMDAGAPYSAPVGRDSDLYDQWLSQVTPQGYDLNYGRTEDGNYSGFRTASDLKAATRGRAESLRRDDRDVFTALDQMASEGLDTAAADYEDRRSESANMVRYPNITPGARPRAPMKDWSSGAPPSVDPVGYEPQDAENLPPGTNIARNVARLAAGPPDTNQVTPTTGPSPFTDMVERYEHQGFEQQELKPWLAEATAPLLEQQDFAQQGLGTPIANYAMRAGAEYGVDPNIVAGWYPDDSAIGDFKDQRDLDTLEATGMPYADYESALADLERQQAGEEADAEDEYDDSIENEINSRVLEGTGGLVSADRLAQQTGVEPIDALNIVASDAYQGYAAEIQAALDETTATGDPSIMEETMNSVLTQAAFQDPALFDVLQAVYGDYTPDDFSVYAEG